MLDRLVQNWVYGGFLAAFVLLGLTPVLATDWSPALKLVYLWSPLYMIHQYEEHDDDRFRRFFNAHLGNGKELLTPTAVFVINVPGVWGINAVSFALAATIDLGYGLIAVYLAVVNALVHVAQGVRMRRYNPGLITAIVLFVPFGALSFLAVNRAGGAPGWAHALGLGLAVAIHAAIVLHVVRRAARLRGA
ncbi:MAG: HXXEE domain-containing protein [Myxococcota bacterium]